MRLRYDITQTGVVETRVGNHQVDPEWFPGAGHRAGPPREVTYWAPYVSSLEQELRCHGPSHTTRPRSRLIAVWVSRAQSI